MPYGPPNQILWGPVPVPLAPCGGAVASARRQLLWLSEVMSLCSRLQQQLYTESLTVVLLLQCSAQLSHQLIIDHIRPASTLVSEGLPCRRRL